METYKSKCDWPRFIPVLEVTRKVDGGIEQEIVPLHDGEDVRSRVKEFEEQGAYVSMLFIPALDDE